MSKGIDIMTIHDCSPEARPWEYPYQERRLRKKAARQVPRLLASTVFGKHDIMSRLKVKEERITVVPHAFDQDSFYHHDKMVKTEKPSFVMVGNDHPRKNLMLISRAIKLGGLKGARFYRIGPSLFDGGSLPGITPINAVNDSALREIVGSAWAFLWPSLYEGFGLAPLEAMACHTQTLMMATPLNLEVFSDYSTFLGEYPIIWNSALRKAVREGPIPDAFGLHEAATHANQYTFERTARGFLEVYKKAGY